MQYVFRLGPAELEHLGEVRSMYAYVLADEDPPRPIESEIEANDAAGLKLLLKAYPNARPTLDSDLADVAEELSLAFGPLPPSMISLRAEIALLFAYGPQGSTTFATPQLASVLLDTACRFAREAPWRALVATTPIRIRVEAPKPRVYEASVLGNNGEAPGLALYPRAGTFSRLLANPQPGVIDRIDSVTVLFDEKPAFITDAIEAAHGVALIPNISRICEGRLVPIDVELFLDTCLALLAIADLADKKREGQAQLRLDGDLLIAKATTVLAPLGVVADAPEEEEDELPANLLWEIDRGVLRDAYAWAEAEWPEFPSTIARDYGYLQDELRLAWAVLHARVRPETAAEAFLEEHGDSLDLVRRSRLEVQMAAHLSLWEVQAIADGRATLLDLLTGATAEVEEPEGLERYDTILARVTDDPPALNGRGQQILQPSRAGKMVADLKRTFRTRQKPIPVAKLQEADATLAMIHEARIQFADQEPVDLSAAWFDRPNPAFGELSPRDAVEVVKHRKTLNLLLKDRENAALRAEDAKALARVQAFRKETRLGADGKRGRAKRGK